MGNLLGAQVVVVRHGAGREAVAVLVCGVEGLGKGSTRNRQEVK